MFWIPLHWAVVKVPTCIPSKYWNISKVHAEAKSNLFILAFDFCWFCMANDLRLRRIFYPRFYPLHLSIRLIQYVFSSVKNALQDEHCVPLSDCSKHRTDFYNLLIQLKFKPQYVWQKCTCFRQIYQKCRSRSSLPMLVQYHQLYLLEQHSEPFEIIYILTLKTLNRWNWAFDLYFRK